MAAEALARLQFRVLKAAVPLVMAPVTYRDEIEQFSMWVSAVTALNDSVRRITFQAPEFAHFTLSGPDECFALIFPVRPDQQLTMPSAGKINVRSAVNHIPEEQRPAVRWYTVRALRPQAGEIDVDIVVHGDRGPGSAWALRAGPGDVVGFRGHGSGFRTPVNGPCLFVADETAMPALYSILESLDPATAATALLELPDATYDTGLDAAIRPEIVLRGAGAPGSAVLARLGELALPALGYAWACGESSLAAGVRRHLLTRGLADRRAIMFSGYWKQSQTRTSHRPPRGDG